MVRSMSRNSRSFLKAGLLITGFLSIGFLTSKQTLRGQDETTPPSYSDASAVELVIEKMHSLQILLGDWKGTTQKNVGQFKGLSQTHWVWDFKTTPDQPFLEFSSGDDHYIRDAQMSWDEAHQQFHLTLQDADGEERVLTGSFTSKPETFTGDGNRENIKFKLQLDQTSPVTTRHQWRLIFNQQDNDRMLLEVHRKVGSRFQRVDTVAYQRLGTSFAKSDEGYGDRECVISGGLGVSQVSYKGTSYWVCCSGCVSAFNDNPEKWIAAFNKRKMAK